MSICHAVASCLLIGSFFLSVFLAIALLVCSVVVSTLVVYLSSAC